MTEVLVAFVSGAVFEGIAVLWVAASARGHALGAAACSMLQGSALALGIGEVHGFYARTAFVVGFGVGSFIAVHATKERA